MFIKRIIRIKNFRAFQDWKDEEINYPHSFGKQTIIFGPNGSGKSTLVDLAWSVKQKQSEEIHDPIIDDVFVELTDGVNKHKCSLSSNDLPNIEVFGKQYIKSNLYNAFEEGEKGTALYVIGKKNIDLEKDILSLETDIKTAEENLIKAKKDLSEQQQNVRKVLDRIKIDVSERLSHFNPNKYNQTIFNVTKAENLVKEENKLLTPENLEKEIINLTLTSDSIPDSITFPIPSFPKDIERIYKEISTYNVTSIALDDLISEPDIALWVESGLPLHQDRDHCAFCMNKLSRERLKDLAKHFDESHNHLRDKIKEFSSIIDEWEKELKAIKESHKKCVNKYKEVDSVLKENESSIVDFWKSILDTISQIRTTIEFRVNWPHKKLEDTALILPDLEFWEAISSEIDKLNLAWEQKRKAVSEINETAEKAILSHLGSKHSKDYKDSKELEDDYENNLKVTDSDLKSKQSKLDELIIKRDQELDGQKLAESLSSDLVSYLGHNELSVEFVQEEKLAGFMFLRNGQPAHNLSEGERNAISLLHFLRSLETVECSEKLTDACIVIDDPVSSLDYDSILSAFSFIRTRLLDDQNHLRCKQLLIFTHNFEFFRLWKDSLRNKINKDKRLASNQGIPINELPLRKATILELIMRIDYDQNPPRRKPLIRDFSIGIHALTSEYYYLFARACESTYPEHEDLLPLTGNSTRRLLESFIKFKCPHETNFTSAAETLGKKTNIKPEIISRVVKALHGSSHRTEIDIHSPTFRYGIANDILFALKFIKDVDPTHYDGMCSATDMSPYQKLYPED